jgi:hypothetical protein
LLVLNGLHKRLELRVDRAFVSFQRAITGIGFRQVYLSATPASDLLPENGGGGLQFLPPGLGGAVVTAPHL